MNYQWQCCVVLVLAWTGAFAEAGRGAVVNKQWLKEQSELANGTPTLEVPGPWLRTIYGTVKEVVTPYAIGDIIFATPLPTDPLQASLAPWITLKKDGSPKTVRPKMKDGTVANGFPTVGTHFATATTVLHAQEDLNAHNLKDGDQLEEVILMDEDTTYVSLSPIMRCTPDFFFKRGQAGMDLSEPFCFPHDHQKFRVGKTYFMTWYSRFFENAQKVRIHYAYITEKSQNLGKDKSFKKRGLGGFLNAEIHDAPVRGAKAQLAQLDENSKLKGTVEGAFYSSDWVDNDMGFFPIEVQPEWLQGKYYKRVLMAIQPDTVSDEEFDIMSSSHLYGTFQFTESVGKNNAELRKIRDRVGHDDDFYYIITAIPTIVAITAFCAYLFVIINKKTLDLSNIRKPKRSRFGNKYDLPISMTDVHRPQGYKRA